jgi:hypothetical protein
MVLVPEMALDDVQQLLRAGPPIDLQLLSVLAKQSLKAFLHDEAALDQDSGVVSVWACLVSSTLHANPSEKYLTSACNTISVFLSCCASSPLDTINQFPRSSKVCMEAFSCAQKTLDVGKSKPAVQVLETLTRIWNDHPDAEAAFLALREIAQRQLRVLLAANPSQNAKSACIVLTCLLRRTQLSHLLENVLVETFQEASPEWMHHQLEDESNQTQHSSPRPVLQRLFLALLLAVRNLETRSAALKLFSTVLYADFGAAECKPPQEASAAIQAMVSSDSASLSEIADSLLPVVLDTSSRYQAFLNLCTLGKEFSISKTLLYLSVLRVGRMKKFVSESGMVLHFQQT